MTAVFRIATFVNDEALYAGMRESFELAGFVEPVARYTVEDDEPYGAITRLGRSGEPYVLLVHQDVRCDQGDTAEGLSRRVDELTRLDGLWAVAGNAGCRPDRRLVRHISDPHGADWADGLPARVVTLDENLLILRTSRKPRCSPSLSGFHLYGADVCLNAARDGSSCYVVDFKMTHMSGGDMEGLGESAAAFARAWATRFPRYVTTPSALVPLRKSAFGRRVMAHPKVRDRLLRIV